MRNPYANVQLYWKKSQFVDNWKEVCPSIRTLYNIASFSVATNIVSMRNGIIKIEGIALCVYNRNEEEKHEEEILKSICAESIHIVLEKVDIYNTSQGLDKLNLHDEAYGKMETSGLIECILP